MMNHPGLVSASFLTLAACAEPPAAEEPITFTAAECEIGIYQQDASRFVAITQLTEGYRYTLSDGHMGRTSEDNSEVECGDSAVRVNGADIWPGLAITQTDTRFEALDGVMLAGRLIEPPAANSSTPLVVYAHGSEELGWIGSARDPYQMVGRGVSVFVYDKRGTGLSEGAYNQNFPRLADDLVAASAEAKRLAADRFGRFGLVGLSQGGWIAPLATDRTEADFMGVGYGLVVDIREEDVAQVVKTLTEAGYGPDVLAKAKELTDATAQIVTTGYQEGLEEMEAAREKYRDEPWYPLVRGEYTIVLLSMSIEELRENGIPAFDRLDVDWSLNPVEVLSQVTVPQLWALAGEDREAPIAVTLERLSSLRENGQDISIYVFPDTDHGMWEYDQAPDGTRENTRVTAGFYDLMADWAKGEVTGPYGRAEEK
ncbi:MAG: alpha/beta hydrolase [Pseudomonadota bacterium]